MKTALYILTVILLVGCSVDNKIVVPVKYEGKYGFIDNKGKWLIQPSFDSISNFYNGYADYFIDNQQGLINSEGKIVIEAKYDFISLVENERVLVSKDNKYSFSDLKGKTISKSHFSDAEDFSEGLAPVQFNENGKWGYLNINGHLKIDTLFYSAYEFKNGFAEVEIETIDTTEVNSNYIVLEPKFYDCKIDKSGKIIDTIEFVIKKRKFPLIGSANTNTLGKINSRGDTIMQKKYRSFGYPQGRYMRFFTGEKYGLADTIGTILIKPIYQKFEYFSKNGLAVAKLNDKFGFINSNGNIVIDFIYEDAKGFKYDLAPVKLNQKWGFIDRKGNFIIKPKYDNVNGHFVQIQGNSEPRIYEYSEE